ncbi:MAG: outer membrane protein assembly factor BamA [Thermodesulfovibrionales bacterium]
MQRPSPSLAALLALAAAVLFLVFPAALPAQDEPLEHPVVRVVEVEGLKRIEPSAVRGKISQRIGEPLSPEKVSDDIKEIFKMGYFEDVRVEIEPFEGGVRLVFLIKEKPPISRVEFQGNRKIEDDKLREKVTITAGAISDSVLIQNNAEKLRAFYEEEGYPLAEVVPVVRKLEDRVFLTYQIDEGPKVKVGDIVIEGNEALSDRKVRKAMKTKEWWMFSFLTGSGKYEKSKLAEDVTRVRNLYHDNGYIQAVVSEPEITLSEDKRRMTISLRVSEGPQFTISAVEFSDGGVYTEDELRENVKSAPGEVVSRGKLWDDVSRLTSMYTEKGYATASVWPDIDPDVEARRARVVFRIRPGDIYHVGRIEISGNLRTRDKVIRREMRLDEGDVFNSALLKRSYQRINNLNLFEEVNVKPEPRPEEKELDIDVKVRERSTGLISVGGGYSSIDKLVATADITQANLGGRGQYIKLSGEFGSRTSFYEVSFKDPWFLDKPVSFTTSIYNTRREFTDYNKRAAGFMFGFGKAFGEFWRGSAAYRIERADVFDVDEDASLVIKEQEGDKITSSISPSISRDSRDNFLDPHSGSRNVLTATFAGLGGDNKFYKAQLDSGWYFPLTELTTFSLRGRYGYSDGFGGEDVPLYERFYVGGIYTIRGLDFGEAGPKDENGVEIGGKQELIFNAEFIFPIVPSINLKGVVFYDAGGAYDKSLDRIWQTAGAGIRWISPVGPIRIEWGKNLDPEPGDTDSKWEFAFGTFF